MKTIYPILNLTFFTFIITILTSCGGGGSSTNTENQIPQTDNSNNYQLVVKSVIEDKCGNLQPHSNSEVIIHRDDWSVIERKQSNEQGIATFNLPSNKPVALSQVTFFDNGNVFIDSYSSVSIEEIQFLIKSSTIKNDQCNCVDGEIEFFFPEYENENFILENASKSIERKNSNTYTVEACYSDDGWVPQYAHFYVKTGKATRKYFAAIIEDFTGIENETIAINAEKSFRAMQLAYNLDYYSIQQIYKNQSFRLSSPVLYSLIYFPTFPYFETSLKQISGTNTLASEDSFYFIEHQLIHTNNIEDVNLLKSDESLIAWDSDISTFFNDDSNYDFSNVIPYPFFSFDIYYQSDQDKRITMNYLGSTKGTLPTFKIFDDLYNLSSNIVSADIRITFSKYSQGITETNEYLSQKSQLGPISFDNYLTHPLKQSSNMIIGLNDVLIDPNSNTPLKSAIKSTFKGIQNK